MQQEKQPNIVLVLSDQQRWDSLGCYGNSFVHSPNTDRMARQGTAFSHCFTPWPLCTPARATMWTGLYPHAHKIVGNVYGVDDALVSVSQDTIVQYGVQDALHSIAHDPINLFGLLKQSGYATAYFGKWHLGTKNPGMFDVWDAFNSLGSHWVDSEIDGRYKPDVQTDNSIAFLESRAKSKEPFVMVQSYYPPHDPFTAPRRFYEHYRGKGVPFAGYYAAVSNIDHNLGRIDKAIDDLGLADETILIFFSDHGETFKYRDDGEHKLVCFDESIRIPFIVKWPGRVPSGKMIDSFIGLQDLMPTVLDYVGASIPEGLHGKSVRPLIEARAEPWRESYYVENVTFTNGYQQRCIRTAQWKLILSDKGPHSLFDLGKDPEEELDIFDTPRSDEYDQYIHFPSQKSKIVELATELRRQALMLGDSLGGTLADRVLFDSAG